MTADLSPMLTLAEAAALLPDARLSGDAAVEFHRVHSDTRSLRPGDLFVALEGERFDGHDFLPQARASGAVAALACHGLVEAGLPGLQVRDSLAGLQALAAAWRARHTLPLIAVTGSNGKTTVTQMLAVILRAWYGDASLATAGNFNNHIGLPLTLLRLRPTHLAAVVELGMNHPGEIALLAHLAQPTVALVNNAQREHQEFMASVEAVAQENGAVFAALADDGVAVYPADDRQAPVWRALAGQRRCMTFALSGNADVTAQAQWQGQAWAVTLSTPAGPIRFTLNAAGQHNVRNALAAATSALAAGAPLAMIAAGLEAFTPVAGRSQSRHWQRRWQRGEQALTLVDDSYNANPDSVRAAIDMLASLPGPQWLLLGDMGEVGDQGPAYHREVGAYAQARGIAGFWCVGALCADAASAYGPGARHFASVDALIAELPGPDLPLPAASLLVKGSRFMRMERVVRALTAEVASHAA